MGIECWERNRGLEAEIQRETERKTEMESQIERDGDGRQRGQEGEWGGGTEGTRG